MLNLHEGEEVEFHIETGKLIVSPLPSAGTRDSASSRDKVLGAHKRVLEKHAGCPCVEILESTVAVVQACFGGSWLHRDIFD